MSTFGRCRTRRTWWGLAAGLALVAATSAGTVTVAAADQRPGTSTLASIMPTTVTVPNAPVAIAVDATRHEAFVANAGLPTAPVLSPSGAVLTPGSPANPSVSIISTQTGALIGTIQLAATPVDIVVDPGLGRLYVSLAPTPAALSIENKTGVLPPAHIAVLSETYGVPAFNPINVPPTIFAVREDTVNLLFHMAIDTTTHTLYVSGQVSTYLAKINLNPGGPDYDNPVAVHLACGGATAIGFAIAVDQATGTIYVSDGRSTNIMVIPSVGACTTWNFTGAYGSPFDLAVGTSNGPGAPPGGATVLWATVPTHGLVLKIVNGALKGTIALGTHSFPEGVAVDPSAGDVYVSDFGLGDLNIYNETTDALVGQATNLGQPIAVAVDGVQHAAVTADSDGTTAFLIQGPGALAATPASTPSSAATSVASTAGATHPATTASSTASPVFASPSSTPTASAPPADTSSGGVPTSVAGSTSGSVSPSATTQPSPAATAAATAAVGP